MISTIFEILGSLGVFLYGMKVLSEGIQKVAGSRMRKFMETMTRNRFSGIMTGFLTTCLLQSSSATTVIVVSFVNAGLLTLVESIGVIMGANLGTTLTAWIIALIGKFSLSKVALPIIGVGLPVFFAGKGRGKSFGEILIGFGLLFFGLGLLKNSVPDVQAMISSEDPMIAARANAALEWIKDVSGYGFFSLLIFLALGVVVPFLLIEPDQIIALVIAAATSWLFAYIVAHIDVMVLRRRRPEHRRPYRTPFYPLPQILGIIGMAYVAANASPSPEMTTLIYTLLGVVLGIVSLIAIVWVKFKMNRGLFEPDLSD